MVEPAAKRLCSTVASVVRRVAVEGNIGEGRGGCILAAVVRKEQVLELVLDS